MVDIRDVLNRDEIDLATFEQILEMDDGDEDDDAGFSRSIVYGFFEQAEHTFEKMDAALAKGDLKELSSKGHFLKGSAATLGFTKIKDECEKIQNLGQNRDETGNYDEKDEKKCLELIRIALVSVKKHYSVVEQSMKQYYESRDEA